MHDEGGLRVGSDSEVLVQFVVGNAAPYLVDRTVTCSAKINPGGTPFAPVMEEFDGTEGQFKMILSGEDLDAEGALLCEFTIPDVENKPHINPNERVIVIPVRSPFEDVNG